MLRRTPSYRRCRPIWNIISRILRPLRLIRRRDTFHQHPSWWILSRDAVVITVSLAFSSTSFAGVQSDNRDLDVLSESWTVLVPGDGREVFVGPLESGQAYDIEFSGVTEFHQEPDWDTRGLKAAWDAPQLKADALYRTCDVTGNFRTRHRAVLINDKPLWNIELIYSDRELHRYRFRVSGADEKIAIRFEPLSEEVEYGHLEVTVRRLNKHPPPIKMETASRSEPHFNSELLVAAFLCLVGFLSLLISRKQPNARVVPKRDLVAVSVEVREAAPRPKPTAWLPPGAAALRPDQREIFTSTSLKEGRAYRLILTGTYTAFDHRYHKCAADALYCQDWRGNFHTLYDSLWIDNKRLGGIDHVIEYRDRASHRYVIRIPGLGDTIGIALRPPRSHETAYRGHLTLIVEALELDEAVPEVLQEEAERISRVARYEEEAERLQIKTATFKNFESETFRRTYAKLCASQVATEESRQKVQEEYQELFEETEFLTYLETTHPSLFQRVTGRLEAYLEAEQIKLEELSSSTQAKVVVQPPVRRRKRLTDEMYREKHIVRPITRAGQDQCAIFETVATQKEKLLRTVAAMNFETEEEREQFIASVYAWAGQMLHDYGNGKGDDYESSDTIA